jgi:branched-chain amino acid transport system ATP-binding protein
MMLSVRGLQASYGASQALFDVALDIGEGEVVTLLGRNGMGKTTTVRAIMGLIEPTAGEAHFEERSLRGLAPERVARLGLGLVPEGRQVFPTLTVRENPVATAANRRNVAQPWTLARIFALFPRLEERLAQPARLLSGGEQQMLAIGRALMTNPKLLILDEATEGLAPVVRAEIWACLETLKAAGHSILLIDKNIAALLRLADRHVILDRGRTVWTGDSAALRANAELIHRYVGV